MTLAKHSEFMHQCLLDGDVQKLRKLWRVIAPNMPQPESDADAEISMHISRTQIASMPFRARAYSHAWLMERTLPSGLPDELRPRAERMYPKVKDAVGVAILAATSADEGRRVLGVAVRDAMSGVVMDHYSSDRKVDTGRLRSDMWRARADVWRKALRTVGWRP